MFDGSVAKDVFSAFATLLILPIALSFIFVALKLLRGFFADRSEYVRNQERSVSLMSVLRGETPTFYDSVRDERIVAGVAVDTKKNVWVEQGKLSEEAVSNVIR